MASMATWGGQVFKVTPDMQYTFSNYSRKTSYKTTTKDRTGKKPTTKRNGPELGTLSFDIVLDDVLGVNTGALLNWWFKSCDAGKVDYLLLGGKQHGPHKWQLKDVSASEMEIAKGGRRVHAKLSVSFVEWAKKTPKAKKTTTRSSKSVKKSKK